jgi:heme/copper-type cytochrome/quinol oxidase subunit 4
MSKEFTIAEVAEKVLLENGFPMSAEEIHNYILEMGMYSFKEGANSLHILKIQIDRKCINSNLSYKVQDLLFYVNNENKYGLLKETGENELKKYLTFEQLEQWLLQNNKTQQSTIDQITRRLDILDKTFQNLDEYVKRAEDAELAFMSSKKSFDELSGLHEVTKYWDDKKLVHESSIRKFSIAFAVSIIITIVCFFILVPHYNDTVTDKQALLAVGKLLFITSIGIWISRTFLKIILSNLHLAEEAREKKTMNLTYLALIKEKAGLEENDRKIILEATFRPSNNGIIQDDSNVTILDIVKILKSK